MFFSCQMSNVELVTMNDQMIFSKPVWLFKSRLEMNYFYGIDDGSLVFCNDIHKQPGMSFYRIALTKPERLDILAKAKAQKSAKSRRFLKWTASLY